MKKLLAGSHQTYLVPKREEILRRLNHHYEKEFKEELKDYNIIESTREFNGYTFYEFNLESKNESPS